MWSTGEDTGRVVVEVDVAGGPVEVELVADELLGLGASAVTERDDGGTVVLCADLEAGRVADLEALGRSPRIVEPDPSWRTAWRAGARAVRVGRLAVRPPWVPASADPADPADAAVVRVVVDPGDAFGSGAHPSTAGCLAEVDALVRPGDRVLDVGSGSGVLGVAALALGAGSVVAVDTDPEARRVTAEVADANGVGGRLVVADGSLDDGVLAASGAPFDLVLANVLVGTVEDLAPQMRAAVAPGGHVVVGGVLGSQARRVVAALAPLEVVSVRPAPGEGPEGWTTVVLGRDGLRARP